MKWRRFKLRSFEEGHVALELAAEAKAISAGCAIGVVQSEVYGEKDGERMLCAIAIVTLRSISIAR